MAYGMETQLFHDCGRQYYITEDSSITKYNRLSYDKEEQINYNFCIKTHVL